MIAMNVASAASDASSALAVLVSGGLDSAILLAESLPRHSAVWPLYVRFGLFWEETELSYLRRFLGAVASPTLQSLTVLDVPVTDLYGEHWSLTGIDVPAAGTPDAAVYLPGRNVLFLSKAMLWCHLRSVPTLALAPLESNPFADATAEFFADYRAVVNRAIGGTVCIERPYCGMHKEEVLRRGRHLPLQWTFSCMRPIESQHCGVCNKCAERRIAFLRAGLPDPTDYHREPSCSA